MSRDSRGGDAFVIAVGGPSGAGKSTLVAALTEALTPSTSLFYDHYYRTVADWACRYEQWVAGGSHPDQFISITRLVDDLRALRNGRAVILPSTGRMVEPASWIILEEPWGRQRSEIAPLIDAVVHIDIPLDISLARRLLRDAQRGNDPLALLQAYVSEPLHEIYSQQQRGADTADVIVDGRSPVTQNLAAVVLQLQTARTTRDHFRN